MKRKGNQTEDLILPATNNDLFVLISRIYHFLNLARQQELSQYRITPQQLLVLRTIRALGAKAMIVEIARNVERKPDVLSRQISTMEKDGLVTKNQFKSKTRAVRVSLTDYGLAILKNNSGNETIDQLLSFLTGQQRQKMYLELNNVLNKLNKQVRPH